jgi:hypothetical protein
MIEAIRGSPVRTAASSSSVPTGAALNASHRCTSAAVAARKPDSFLSASKRAASMTITSSRLGSRERTVATAGWPRHMPISPSTVGAASVATCRVSAESSSW